MELIRGEIIEMSPRGSPHTNPPHHLTTNFNRKPPAQNQHLAVDVTQSLKRGNFRDQIGQLAGGAPHTGRRIGFFPTAVDSMGTSTIGASHGTQDTGTINDRHTHTVPVLLTGFYCRMNGLIRGTK